HVLGHSRIAERVPIKHLAGAAPIGVHVHEERSGIFLRRLLGLFDRKPFYAFGRGRLGTGSALCKGGERQKSEEKYERTHVVIGLACCGIKYRAAISARRASFCSTDRTPAAGRSRCQRSQGPWWYRRRYKWPEYVPCPASRLRPRR